MVKILKRYVICGILCLLFFYPFDGISGEKIIIKCSEDTTIHYLMYQPVERETYHKVLYILDPAGRAEEASELRKAAKKGLENTE